MENLDQITRHLKNLERDFYGEIVIRVRDGQAVLITEERSFKIEPEERAESRDNSHA